MLQSAWEYTPSDRMLHCLPLHHIHGLMNVLIAPHAAGAAVSGHRQHLSRTRGSGMQKAQGCSKRYNLFIKKVKNKLKKKKTENGVL